MNEEVTLINTQEENKNHFLNYYKFLFSGKISRTLPYFMALFYHFTV